MFETPYTPRFSIDNKSVKSHRRLSFLSMAPQQSNDSDKQRPATAKNRASISTSRFSFFRSDATKTPTKKEKKERSLTSKIPQPAGLKAYRYTELPESDAPRSDDARSQSRESFNNIERPSPIVNKQDTPSSSSIPAPPLAAPSVAPAPLRISTQDRPMSPPTKKSPFDIPSPPPQSSPTSRPKSAASLTNARRRVSGILPPGFSSQKTYYRNSAPPESTVPLEGAPRLARSASCPRLAEQAASDLPTGNLKANYFMAHRPPSDSGMPSPTFSMSSCWSSSSCYSQPSCPPTPITPASAPFDSVLDVSKLRGGVLVTETQTQSPPPSPFQQSTRSVTLNLTWCRKRRSRYGLPVSSRKHFSAAHPLYRVECFSSNDLTNALECT